jgi:Ca-activated chloride channel family protein
MFKRIFRWALVAAGLAAIAAFVTADADADTLLAGGVTAEEMAHDDVYLEPETSTPAETYGQPVQTKNEGQEGLVKDAAIRSEAWTASNGFKGWKVHVPDGKPLATPAVADGVVFVGGGFGTYDFYAFNAEDGNLKWQYHVGDDGPTAAIVHKGRVAFNTESCILYVLDAQTGDKVWSQYLGDPLMAMPAAAGDKLYMTYPGGDGYHHISCRNLETGGELWQQPLTAEAITSPIISGDAAFVSCADGTVFHFGADSGKLIWKDQKLATSAPWVVGEDVFVSKRQEQSEGGTTVQYEGIASLDRGAGGQNNADLYAYGKADYLNAEEGTAYANDQKKLDSSVGFASAPAAAKLDLAQANLGVGSVSGYWAYQGSRPLVVGGISYNAMGDAVRAVDVKSGKVLWEQRYKPKAAIGGRALTPPSLAGDNLYFGSTDGDVICVRSGDGKELWRFNVGEAIRFQPAVMGGRVFVGTDLGNIFCVNTGDAAADGWAMWGGNAGHNGWEE